MTSQPINVLHLRDTDKICGPGKTMLETACRIDRDRFALTIGVFARPHEKQNAYLDALASRGVAGLRVESSGRFDFAVLKTIEQVIRERNIHIVHAHEYKSDVLTALLRRRLRIPIVTTVHGWIQNSLKAKINVTANKMVLRYFDRVIAVSPKIRNELLRWRVRPERLHLIYNAIVMESYDPSAVAAGSIRARFGIAPSDRIIGAIGRLSPEKGQVDLLRAVAEQMRRSPRVHVVFAGDGPDRNRLVALAAELGIAARVHFAGHLTDVRPVYRDIDVLALTSHTEGFPNVILEALCMGVPVLATDVGGVADIINDGITGVLVQAGDLAAIAEGVERLLEHRDWASQTVAEGRRLVTERFQFGARVARIEQLYDGLMQEWRERERSARYASA